MNVQYVTKNIVRVHTTLTVFNSHNTDEQLLLSAFVTQSYFTLVNALVASGDSSALCRVAFENRERALRGMVG